jgi:hypothetical protein
MSSSVDLTRHFGQSPLRVPFDFYATPPEATRALLSVEHFDGSVWEPACGDGRISRVLLETGHQVVSTDLIDRGFGASGIDFLKERTSRAKHIVTNPPYGSGLADRFIGRALILARQTSGKIAMLLDIASLCHPTRHARYVSAPPAAVYALDELVCVPHGNEGHIPSMRRADRRYCWMVWKPDHLGPSRLWWLSTRPFRDWPNATMSSAGDRLAQTGNTSL